MVRPSYSVLFSFSQAASASSLLANRTVPKPLLCGDARSQRQQEERREKDRETQQAGHSKLDE